MYFLGVKKFGLICTSPSLIPLSTPPGISVVCTVLFQMTALLYSVSLGLNQAILYYILYYILVTEKPILGDTLNYVCIRIFISVVLSCYKSLHLYSDSLGLNQAITTLSSKAFIFQINPCNTSLYEPVELFIRVYRGLLPGSTAYFKLQHNILNILTAPHGCKLQGWQ